MEIITLFYTQPLMIQPELERLKSIKNIIKILQILSLVF